MFKDFIQDFLEKLPGIEMIVTCVNSIPCFNDVNNCIYKVKELSRKHTLELLKVRSESYTDHTNKLRELIDSETNVDFAKKNILEHPLFNFLGGHPLSIVILSTLRQNMSLVEIYELLQLIKSNHENKHIDQSTLALTLSIQVNLVFLDREDKNLYKILLNFAI